VIYSAPLKVNIFGLSAILGPTSVQAPAVVLSFPTALALTLAQAVFAFKIAEKGMSFAG
jgi:hypothetical protein